MSRRVIVSFTAAQAGAIRSLAAIQLDTGGDDADTADNRRWYKTIQGAVEAIDRARRPRGARRG